MRIKVLIFGVLSDIIGDSVLELNSINTDELLKILYYKYPELKKRKFQISVNQIVCTDVTNFLENDEIALLPPYSGG